MKELYLGIAITAFIVLILSITLEVSMTGSFLNKSKSNSNSIVGANNTNKVTTKAIEESISKNNLNNTFPDRVYDKNNLNKLFLEKYYKNVNYNPENKFYVSN